jgi:hypothetical protein
MKYILFCFEDSTSAQVQHLRYIIIVLYNSTKSNTILKGMCNKIKGMNN